MTEYSHDVLHAVSSVMLGRANVQWSTKSFQRVEPLHYKSTLRSVRAVPQLLLLHLISDSRMAFLDILRIALVSTLLFASASGVCVSPSVRREWRSIRPDERAAWINAVKVNSLFARVRSNLPDLGNLQCLAKLPHDPKIVPTVDPAFSLIPPMTPNSSYFDGERFTMWIIHFSDPD